jgi:hypothetical protein
LFRMGHAFHFIGMSMLIGAVGSCDLSVLGLARGIGAAPIPRFGVFQQASRLHANRDIRATLVDSAIVFSNRSGWWGILQWWHKLTRQRMPGGTPRFPLEYHARNVRCRQIFGVLH